ncbi:DUF2752 domain-containing protein [Streptomyces sp. CA-132043]|uniref:DUF2752 domain-containing protein n=1 Tax=Streptomyces sp. CA-132043 TaxID=3240048 RepID=UPI003D8A6BF4
MTEPVARTPDGPPAAARRGAARRLAAPLGALAAVLAAFAYVGAVDPNEAGHYPVCPLLRLTGLYCPACGGLRSAHAVAHGDLGAALGANAPAVLGYAAFALFWAVWLVRAGRGLPAAGLRPRPAHWWLIGGAVLLFTVVRNLPAGSALAP